MLDIPTLTNGGVFLLVVIGIAALCIWAAWQHSWKCGVCRKKITSYYITRRLDGTTDKVCIDCYMKMYEEDQAKDHS